MVVDAPFSHFSCYFDSVASQRKVDVYFSPTGNHIDNPNDIFVWIGAPDPVDPANGDVRAQSEMKVVQLPTNYNFDGVGVIAEGLEGPEFGSSSGRFQAELGPVFANGGRQVHWSSARGNYRLWQIDPNAQPSQILNRAQNVVNSYGRNLNAGEAYKGGRAAPVIGPEGTDVAGDSFYPTAHLEFARVPSDATDQSAITRWDVPADDEVPIWGAPVVSPDGAFVYFCTQSGTLYRLTATTLQTSFASRSLSIGRCFGDLAMNNEGTVIYLVDETPFGGGVGNIVAIQVAEGPSPAPTISAAPTVAPSASPTMNPTTATPTVEPDTPFPTPAPTQSPTTTPTPDPTPIRTLDPTPGPTEPTAAPSAASTKMIMTAMGWAGALAMVVFY